MRHRVGTPAQPRLPDFTLLLARRGAFPGASSGFLSFRRRAEKVLFVNPWSDATEEGSAAAPADQGCKLISQHSGNTTTVQSKGIFHTGYNNDIISGKPLGKQLHFPGSCGTIQIIMV